MVNGQWRDVNVLIQRWNDERYLLSWSVHTNVREFLFGLPVLMMF